MKYLIIMSSCLLAVLARPQSSQYGAPSNSGTSIRGFGGGSSGRSIKSSSSSSNGIRNSNNGQQGYNLQSSTSNNAGSFGGYSNGGGVDNGGSLPDGPKVYKHISIHVPPPDEFDVPTKRVIRPMMASDKHINIIFVKAPSGSSSQQTEVILPEEPQHKTIVYILVKKRDQGQNDIKIRQAAPTRPPKPEVYFIKYARGSASSAAASATGTGNVDGGQSESQEYSGPGVDGGASSRPEYGVPSNLV